MKPDAASRENGSYAKVSLSTTERINYTTERSIFKHKMWYSSVKGLADEKGPFPVGNLLNVINKFSRMENILKNNSVQDNLIFYDRTDRIHLLQHFSVNRPAKPIDSYQAQRTGISKLN